MSKKNTFIKVLFTSAAMISSLQSHASWASFWGTDKIQDTDSTLGSRVSENIGSAFSSCAYAQCKTMAGLTNCLLTNENYKKYEGGAFFKKNSDGTFMQRITNVTVALATSGLNGSSVTFEKPITIPIIVNVISPSAFKAFQEVARANPHCMQAFCKHNCLVLEKIDPRVIENQVKDFEGKTSIIIGGVTYKSPEIPADSAQGTPRVIAKNDWENKSPEEQSLLAQQYLIEQANRQTSLRCLSETDGGVKLRMFCSQCKDTLDQAHKAMLSQTCTSFDSAKNVGYGMELAELNEEYQQELGRARLEQEKTIQQKALEAGSGNITDTNPNATFSGMATQFGAGLPGFLNPGKENRTPIF